MMSLTELDSGDIITIIIPIFSGGMM